LAKRSDVLSPRMLRMVEDLATDWRRLDGRIEAGKTKPKLYVISRPW
jgi:hypothetical protein